MYASGVRRKQLRCISAAGERRMHSKADRRVGVPASARELAGKDDGLTTGSVMTIASIMPSVGVPASGRDTRMYSGSRCTPTSVRAGSHSDWEGGWDVGS